MEKDKDDQYWNRGQQEARELPRQAPLLGYFSRGKKSSMISYNDVTPDAHSNKKNDNHFWRL
jgi:hypothetical protein